ncbi:hypothetical protein GcM1_248025 [Golovinomyces cichoracearum]|uniref:Uncharacterized protein n=1 Tax=Golovinomyces cichoracearum TaxID=62708 RepID=A0A420ICK3_9PEZI|nr:hypothetical protein GcM1_248025 [Golovinomyces cichoracearum]
MESSYKRSKHCHLPYGNRNKAVLGSQLDSTPTNYSGWITTELALKSDGFPKTTLDKLTACQYKSSLIEQEGIENNSTALSARLPQNQVENPYNQGRAISSHNIHFRKNDYEEPHPRIGNRNIQSKFSPAEVYNGAKSTPALIQGRSTTRFNIPVYETKKNSKKNEKDGPHKSSLLVISAKSAAFDGEPKAKTCDFKGKSELSTKDFMYQEKNNVLLGQKNLCVPEPFEIDEFDEGIDDDDFIMADSIKAFPDGELLSNRNKDSTSNIVHSPVSSLAYNTDHSTTDLVDEVNSRNLTFEESYQPPVLMHNLTDKIALGSSKDPSLGKDLTEDAAIDFDSPDSAKKGARRRRNTVENQADSNLTQPKKLRQNVLQPDLGTEGLSDLSVKTYFTQRESESTPNMVSNHDVTIFDTRNTSLASSSLDSILDDSHKFTDPGPFARPEFPHLASDDGPIIGLSSENFLRVCFRIGELIKVAGRCITLRQAPLIELFARVTNSHREPNSTRQAFQFIDLWHNRPPFIRGVLMNYEATRLINQESKVFIDNDQKLMARVLATIRRDSNQSRGWLLHIINIRKTDWEEISWTRKILSTK